MTIKAISFNQKIMISRLDVKNKSFRCHGLWQFTLKCSYPQEVWHNRGRFQPDWRPGGRHGRRWTFYLSYDWGWSPVHRERKRRTRGNSRGSLCPTAGGLALPRGPPRDRPPMPGAAEIHYKTWSFSSSSLEFLLSSSFFLLSSFYYTPFILYPI